MAAYVINIITKFILRVLYESHSVEDITRHEADKISTDTTISCILDVIEKCKARKESKKITDSRREVGKFINMIHRYRDNMLAKIKNPVENGVLEIDPEKAVKMAESGYGEVEHVAIFDEAQRSWTHKRLAEYLKRGGTYGNKLKVNYRLLSRRRSGDKYRRSRHIRVDQCTE